MLTRQATWLILALLMPGCGPNRHQLYQRLPEQDKELYARSQQFMTDHQQERFLGCPDSPCRVGLVEGLQVQERLAKFPSYVREAIVAQRVVPGMTTEALLLSWGRPDQIDRRDVDGVLTECWHFTRSNRDGKMVPTRVFVVRAQVTEVIAGP